MLGVGIYFFDDFEFLFLGKGEIEFYGENMVLGDVLEIEFGDVVSILNDIIVYFFYEDNGEWEVFKSEWKCRCMDV